MQSRRIPVSFVRVIVLGTVVAVGGLSGCSPTKTGMESRAAANRRMNAVGAQVHFEQARQSFATGQLDKALREIDKGLERVPDHAEYHLLKGRVLLEQHRLEQALQSFTRVLDLTPPALLAPPEPLQQAASAGEQRIDPVVAALNAQRAAAAAIVADANYYAGVVHQRWSDDEQAFELYRQAAALRPDKVHFLLAAAESLVALGEFQQAAELIEPRVKYFEHNAALRQLQAQIAMLQGDARRAADLYAEARLLNPDDLGLLEEMMWAQWAAALYAQCHDSAKTLQLLQSPSSSTRQANASANDSRPDITIPRAFESIGRPDVAHLQARCLAMMGRGVEARELYLQITRARPVDPTLWAELGTLCWELGDYRNLAQASSQMLAIAPERYEGYLFRAINERHKGNQSEALRLFHEAAEHAGGVPLPLLMLGQALEQSGDARGAELAYNDALRIDPNCAEAQAILRRFYGQQQITSAPINE